MAHVKEHILNVMCQGIHGKEMKTQKVVRPGGFCTILTRVMNCGEVIWASRGGKLWEGKYVGEINVKGKFI